MYCRCRCCGHIICCCRDGRDGATGAQGIPGQNGTNGASAYEIWLSQGHTGSMEDFLNSLKGEQGIPGKDGISPICYHTNLSTSGASYDVPVGNVIYHLQYATSSSIALSVKSTGSSFLVDIKRSSQYDLAGIEGATLNNFMLTTISQSLDATIFNNSNELHKTWIRQQDPITGLWSAYEVNLFTSNNGSRTDICVSKIYENASY